MFIREFQSIDQKLIDKVVFYGWFFVLLLGQSVFSRQQPVLEWLAVVWLSVGMLIVKKTSCLPLLIVSCAAYLCEIHRPMAWTQVLIAAVFLLRAFFQYDFSWKNRLIVVAGGLAVMFLSWPADWQNLLAEVFSFPKREVWRHFWFPHSQWAIYPFRQSFDRSLLAALVAAIVVDKRYFSTYKVWRSYALCGLVMLVVALGAALFPWQKPHNFLGTTNHASWSAWTLSGAGYNVVFFAQPMATLLAALFLPFWTRKKWLVLALSGLLLPLPLTNQRALVLAMAVFSVTLAGWILVSLLRPGLRSKLVRRWRMTYKEFSLGVVMLLMTCTISLGWFVKMGVINVPARDTDPAPAVTEAVDASEAIAIVPEQPAERVRRAPVASDGSDIWYDNPAVIQGYLVFNPDADIWASLSAGTIITVAENERMVNEDGVAIVAGSGRQDAYWVHVSTHPESGPGDSWILARSNIQDAHAGRFLSGGRGWEMTVVNAGGETVFGPVGERMRTWEAGLVGARDVGQLEGDPHLAKGSMFRDVKHSTFGLPNVWQDGKYQQDFALLRTGSVTSVEAGLILNEFNGVRDDRLLEEGDARLGQVPGNGGNWIELVVVDDGLDLRGWRLKWAVTGRHPLKYEWAKEELRQLAAEQAEPVSIRRALWQRLKQIDRSRYFMWRLGMRQIGEHYLWRGAGAGTWGRFHRSAPSPMEWRILDSGRSVRVRMLDHPHMHNMYLDLIFEYGLLPILLVNVLFVISLVALFRRVGPCRLWIFYFLPVMVMALFQFYLYTFMQMVMLLPLVIVSIRSLQSLPWGRLPLHRKIISKRDIARIGKINE